MMIEVMWLLKRFIFTKTCFLYTIAIFSVLSSLSAQRPTNFDSTRGVPSGQQNAQNQADTVQRPALDFNTFILTENIRASIRNLDTSLNSVHLIEPLYRTSFLPANLGSENSASLPFVKRLDIQGNHLGASLYDQVLDITSEPGVVLVNRSFWMLHYGQGIGLTQSSSLGSSHLETKFYRTFARNIYLNFSYKKYSDDGIRSQSNEFNRLDMKLLQKSKHGKRISFIHYDRPSISEEMDADGSASTANSISLTRSNQSLTFGNSIISVDTATNQTKFTWDSSLKFYKSQYGANSLSINDEDKALLGLKIPGDTLTYNNGLNGISFLNKLEIPKFGGMVSASSEIGFLNFKSGNVTDENLTEVLLNLKYDREINERWNYYLKSKFGFLDANGVAELSGYMNHAYSEQLKLSMGLSIKSQIPSLMTQQIVVNNTSFQENTWAWIKGADLNFTTQYIPSQSKLELSFGSYNNMIVMGANGLYRQLNESNKLLSITLNQQFNLGPIYSNHSLMFQSLTSDSFKPVPLQYAGNVYFKLPLFKKKMKTHVGADVYFIPSYNVPQIYPVAGDFFNPLSSSTSGSILIVNPYLNAKVDRLFIFVKGLNVARSIYDVQSSLVSGFPIYNYRIRFGIRWTLLD